MSSASMSKKSAPSTIPVSASSTILKNGRSARKSSWSVSLLTKWSLFAQVAARQDPAACAARPDERGDFAPQLSLHAALHCLPFPLLHPVDRRFRALAQVLHPVALDARVVLGRLHEVHEVDDVRVEAVLQVRVGDAALGVERLVRLRQREHVGIYTRAEVLERDAQCP